MKTIVSAKDFFDMFIEGFGLGDLVDDIEERIIIPLQKLFGKDEPDSTGGGGAWGDEDISKSTIEQILEFEKNTTPVKLVNELIQGLTFLVTGGIKGEPFNISDVIDTYANGGTPQKGSLFIAGEAGAELVGDLGNGGTSVVNKKQAKQLGIPMFANGTNVPTSMNPVVDSILASLQKQYQS